MDASGRFLDWIGPDDRVAPKASELARHIAAAMNLRRGCITFVMLNTMAVLHAQAPEDFYADSAYRRAQKLYFLAVQSEQYMPEAEKAFHALIQRYGPQAPLQMYLYGLTALKARYSLNPLRKRDYFYEAVSQMDAAVRQHPDDVELRFLRGSFYYYLPFFMGKRKEAEDDLRTLTRLLLNNPELYRKRYASEVLGAIISFLEQSGWIQEKEVMQLRRLYDTL